MYKLPENGKVSVLLGAVAVNGRSSGCWAYIRRASPADVGQKLALLTFHYVHVTTVQLLCHFPVICTRRRFLRTITYRNLRVHCKRPYLELNHSQPNQYGDVPWTLTTSSARPLGTTATAAITIRHACFNGITKKHLPVLVGGSQRRSVSVGDGVAISNITHASKRKARQ